MELREIVQSGTACNRCRVHALGSVQKWRDLVHTLPCGSQALYSTQTTAYTACLVGTPGGDSLDNSRPVIHELPISMQDKAIATVLIVYHTRLPRSSRY